MTTIILLLLILCSDVTFNELAMLNPMKEQFDAKKPQYKRKFGIYA